MANIAATHTSARSAGDKENPKNEWGTPAWLWDLLHQEFNFTIDAAATPENAKLPAFWTKETDGLAQEWTGTIWINPPYSDSRSWIEKAYQVAMAGKATVVLLVGARPDTSYWWAWSRFAEVRFLPERLRFLGAAKGGAPFPSAVLIFHKDMAQRTPVTIYWDVRDPNKRRRKKREE